MKHIDITHVCGHTVTTKFGDAATQMTYDRASSMLCLECASATAEQVEATYSLRELDGSEKQIKWARDIRAWYVRQSIIVRSKLIDENKKQRISIAHDYLLSEMTQASYWINNKARLNSGKIPSELIKEANAQ